MPFNTGTSAVYSAVTNDEHQTKESLILLIFMILAFSFFPHSANLSVNRFTSNSQNYPGSPVFHSATLATLTTRTYIWRTLSKRTKLFSPPDQLDLTITIFVSPTLFSTAVPGKKMSLFRIDEVVWAKIKGYPSWPATVLNPTEGENYKVSGKKNENVYFVLFFAARIGKRQVAWVAEDDMMDFTSHLTEIKNACANKGGKTYNDLRISIDQAVLAHEAFLQDLQQNAEMLRHLGMSSQEPPVVSLTRSASKPCPKTGRKAKTPQNETVDIPETTPVFQPIVRDRASSSFGVRARPATLTTTRSSTVAARNRPKTSYVAKNTLEDSETTPAKLPMKRREKAPTPLAKSVLVKRTPKKRSGGELEVAESSGRRNWKKRVGEAAEKMESSLESGRMPLQKCSKQDVVVVKPEKDLMKLQQIHCLIAYGRHIFSVNMLESQTIAELKAYCNKVTGLPVLQMGLFACHTQNASLLSDEVVIASLNLHEESTFILFATNRQRWFSIGALRTVCMLLVNGTNGEEHMVYLNQAQTVQELKMHVSTLMKIPLQMQIWSGKLKTADSEALLVDAGVDEMNRTFTITRLPS